jgi:hypothetical protein
MVMQKMRNLLSVMGNSLSVVMLGDELFALPQFYDCEVL